MKIIFLYVFTIYILIIEVRSLVLFPNIQMIEKFISKNHHTSNYETYNPYIDLNTVSKNYFLFLSSINLIIDKTIYESIPYLFIIGTTYVDVINNI